MRFHRTGLATCYHVEPQALMGTSRPDPHGKESLGRWDPSACDQSKITPEPRPERLPSIAFCKTTTSPMGSVVCGDAGWCPVGVAGMAVVTGQPSTRGAHVREPLSWVV